MYAVFFIAGLVATAAQILLLRELVVDVAGDETAIGVGLAAWLAGIALGAAGARRRAELRAPLDAARGLAALSLLPAVAIVLGRFLRAGLAPDPGELPGTGLTLLLALFTLLPCGAAVGWLFTALAAVASRRWRAGEAVARLYAVESLGSLAGGLAVTLAAGRVQPLLVMALAACAASLVAWRARRGASLAGWCASPLLVLVTLALAFAARPLDGRSERARFTGTAGSGVPFVGSAHTPYQHLALGGGDVLHLYTSGRYARSFPDPYSAEGLGHLLALLAQRPERVLILGGVEKGLVPVLLRHPVARLTLVEPDEAAFRLLLSRLPQGERAAFDSAAVEVIHADPRRFLSRPECGTFDLVVLLAPEPTTLLRARLATVEFFRLVAGHLSPHGVFATSLPAAPLVLSRESEALTGALVRSLREAFPVVRTTLPSEALALAGWSAEAVTLDPEVLAARWRARGLHSPSFDPVLLPVLLPPDRLAAHGERLDAAVRRAAASTDERPASFLHALLRRRQLAADSRGAALLAAVAGWPSTVLVALALAPSFVSTAWALRRRRGPPRSAAFASQAAAVSGAAALGWSLLLLLSFQTHAGALYGQLGVLVALFMLGLALGSAAASSAVGSAIRRPETETLGATAPRLLRIALALATAFGVALPFALRAAAAASVSGPAAVVAHGALLLAAGAVTGAIFPLATEVRLLAGEPAGTAAGRIETADHAGAAVAALLVAVIFVPRLGLTATAFLLAGLLASTLLSWTWAGGSGEPRGGGRLRAAA